MIVKINRKEYNLTAEELAFVRSQIGEWETSEYKFNTPVLISVPEIARASGISRQAVASYVKRHNLSITVIGTVSFLDLDDVLEHWFN